MGLENRKVGSDYPNLAFVPLLNKGENEMDYQQKIKAVRDAWIEGEQSGIAEDYFLETINPQLDTE